MANLNDKLIDYKSLKENTKLTLGEALAYDKGVVGGYNGDFPLTAATKGNIYRLPATGKFYMCITDYNGTNLTAPNANFEELSVWANRDKLENLINFKNLEREFGGFLSDESSTFLETIKNKINSNKLYKLYYITPNDFTDLSEIEQQNCPYEVVILNYDKFYGFKTLFFSYRGSASGDTSVYLVWAWNLNDAKLVIHKLF